MRTLKFNQPYKIHATTIENGKSLQVPDNTHYGRVSAIGTKHGYVIVSEMDWAHNNGKCYFTLFTTIIQGIYYSAWIEEAKFTDRQLKWMSTHFIKSITLKINT